MTLTEREVVSRAAAGDEDAFRLLADAYHADVIGFCEGQLLDLDLADEAGQLTLIRAYERLASLRDPGAIRPWLMRIARRICADLRRPRQGLGTPESWEMVAAQGCSVVSESVRGELARTLGSLSEGSREVLKLHYIDGHPPRRIADYLGLSPVTVRKRLFDARRALRERMPTEVLREALSRSGTLEQALLGYRRAEGTPTTFTDDFEYGLRPEWQVIVGDGEVSRARACTGQLAYHVGPLHHDLIRLALDTRMTGQASVWIYDDASKPLAAMIIVSVLGGGPVDTNARVGVFERWSPDSYYFQVDDGGKSLRSCTEVRRTTGWHHFKLAVNGAATSAFVDGTLVGQTGLVPCFSGVLIGDGWEAEGAETFMDDFELRISPAFG